ncbi:MAG: holo-ACP synthase [Pseudomonadota bacterium]
MIGIGTDIVQIERVEAVWRRQGERFVNRILTPPERVECDQAHQPWRYLAKRFAAKEAIAKCFSTGIGKDLSWQDMTIERSGSGAPVVVLSATGRELAATKGGREVLLSISDEQEYAVAFAVLVP